MNKFDFDELQESYNYETINIVGTDSSHSWF